MSANQAEAKDYELEQAVVRFERAKQTNAKCIAKELAIRDEFKQMERRKIELATMRKMNEGQRDIWMQDLIETIVLPYSRAWNQKFADCVQKTLPVEIRSMVYSYLLDEDTWDQSGHHFEAVTSVLPPHVGHCGCMKMAHDMPRAPHFLYPEYTGAETALEIVEKLYSSDWFKKKTLYAPTERLEHLIHKDPFGAGFDLASRIRKLHLSCIVDRYRVVPDAHVPSDACQHTPYERRYLDRDRLKSDFNHLLGVVGNEHFQSLEVSVIQRNVRIDVLEEALEAFVGVHRAFRKAGISVSIEWLYHAGLRWDAYGHLPIKCLGKFFTQQRYSWKRRFLLFLKEHEVEMEPQHVRFHNEPSLGLSDNDFVHRMWDIDESFDPTDDEDSEDDDCNDSNEEGDDDRALLSRWIYDRDSNASKQSSL